MQWHHKLFPLCRDMLGLATNPIPIKAAMKLLGRDTGELRLPMTPLDAASEAQAPQDADQLRAAVGSAESRRGREHSEARRSASHAVTRLSGLTPVRPQIRSGFVDLTTPKLFLQQQLANSSLVLQFRAKVPIVGIRCRTPPRMRLANLD